MANEVKLKLAIDGAAQVSGQLDAIEQKLGGLGTAIGKIGHYGAALYAIPTALNATVGSMVRAADAITTLNTQLRLATGSTAQATQAYGALFDMAQKSRVSFTELGTTFAAISRAGREMGVSQERLLTVTQSISQAMTIGGGSAASMQAALVQLGQGLSSGTLRGEELNSIMEQTPRLAKAIADGLGVPIGKLREMGAAGELTSQQLIAALEKSGPQLAKEMESATLTVGQAMTMLSNSTAKMVGDADAASGASATLAGALKGVSDGIDTVGNAINNNKTAFAVISGSLAGATAIAGLAAVAANIGKIRTAILALNVALVSNPLTLALLGIGAAVGAAYSMVDARAKSLEGMKATLKALESSDGVGMYGTKASDAVIKQRLQDIARLRQSIAELETASTDTRAEDARLARLGTAYKATLQDREAFATAGEAFLSKDQKNQATLNTEIDKARAMFERGSISAGEYAQRINAVQASFVSAAKGAKEIITEQQKAAKLMDDLVAKDSGFNANFAEQWVLLSKVADGTAGLEQARAALLSQQPGAIAAEKAQADAADANTKAVDALFEAQEKTRVQVEDSIKTARTTLEQIEVETALLTMNTEQRALATMERELERQGIVKGTLAYDAYIVKLREAMSIKTGKEDSIKAASDMADAQKKAAEESGKFWEDALMRAFESGKGFFQSLWDTIKNTLKTQILKVTVQGVMGTLGLGASGAAMAGGGGTDIFGFANTASSLTNLYNAGSSIISIGGQVAAGTMSIANALGTMAANATGTGISGLLATNGAFGTAAAGSAAGIGGSITAGLAAIPGWGWALMGVAAAAAIFKGGETRSGATYDVGADGLVRKQQGPSGGEIAGDEARRLFTVATDSITGALAAVGSQAKLSGFVAGLESSEKGRGFDFAGGYIDGVGFGEYSGREGDKNGQFPLKSQTAEQAFANYTTQLKQATVQALQAATDVPKTIKDMLSGVDANALTGEAVDALLNNINIVVGTVNSFKEAVKTLPFEQLKTLSFDAAAGLIAFSGGMEQLGANLGGFYENFFTAAEKTAHLTTQTTAAFAALGETMPAADASMRDWYRTLVESKMALDQSIPANAAATAAALSLQGAVNQLAPAFASAATALSATMSRLRATTADLQIALMSAQGNTVGASAAQYAIDTTGMTAAETAQFDYNAALTAQITAQNAVTAAEGDLTTARAEAAASAAADHRQSIELARSTAAESVAAITRVFDVLKSNVQSLYGQVQSTTAGQAVEANAFIEQALATAKLTGYLPDIADLTDAINAARQGIDSTVYASQFDADFAKLVLAGKLSGLQGISGSELTLAEQALDVATNQLSALDEINSSVQSVAKAIASLNLAKTNLATTAAATQTALTASVKPQVAAYVGTLNLSDAHNATAAVATNAREQAIYDAYGSVLGRSADAGGLAYYASSAMSMAEITASLSTSIEASVRAQSVAQQNEFISQVVQALGLTTDIKAFAGGGYHTGGLRIVGENGPELEATGPSRIFNASQTQSMLSGGGNTARLERLVEGLTAEVQRLQSIVREGNRSNERIETAVHGNPDRPVPIDVLENSAGLVTA